MKYRVLDGIGKKSSVFVYGTGNSKIMGEDEGLACDVWTWHGRQDSRCLTVHIFTEMRSGIWESGWRKEDLGRKR